MDLRDWARDLASYRLPSDRRGAFEVAVSLLPLAALWVLMWLMLDISYVAVLLLSVPAAGFLVRLFLIQHDCGHGSFFRHRRLNDWAGRVCGVLTFTPYSYWRDTHALHHAGSGDLDRRGYGDIDTLTVAEYRSRSIWGQLRYRLYRHPAVMFGLGPAYLFLLRHRFPVGLTKRGRGPWVSAMGTNLAILVAAAVLVWLIGLKALLMVHVPIILTAASIGVWLFYVQHQFEHTSWDRDEDWKWHDAAFHGSSHYDLPGPLRWFTANIGMHHVHHLSSRIPYYRLPETMRAFPELGDVNRLTLMASFACVKLALWDEERRRLVSFRTAMAG